MKRRDILLSVSGTLALAGCLGGSGEVTPESTPRETTEPTESPTQTATLEPTTESTPTATSTPAQGSVDESTPESETVSEPTLTIQNQSLSSVDTPFHNAYAEVVVENTGSTRCGTIELTARWFNDSGSFIGEDTTSLPTLDVGETWVARVGTSKERGEIGDFEVSGEYDVSPGAPADRLTVANSSLDVEDEYSGGITSEIENTRDESLFMASFHGLIYDSEGRVIGGRETLESDIPPGEDLFFEVSLSSTRTVHRISEVTEHAVLVTKSRSTDTRRF